ncbi:MAG: putative iron-regulated protein [Flavobacteriales bacterium]|jgi:putative iron-regulated protein|tara:strand:+ start:921 stop:2099 length:1179 start_codon:yes stop_codon:yes gene_type:complete
MKNLIKGVVIASVIFTSCKEKEDDKTDLGALKSATKVTYANIAFANYSDAHSEAKELKIAIDAFVANPSESTQNSAKTAWKEAREPYGLTEAFRFSEGPIDDSDGPEGLLNAWPLDEGYIDYTASSDSGIIERTASFPSISASILEGANEEGGETNVAIGYHAIEFLLWGQDDADVTLKTPGSRSYTDYSTDENAARRGEYLKVCANLLVDQLLELKEEWNPSETNNFRKEFLAMDNDAALQIILTGIGILSKGELAGERIFVALNNQDQEDEHSCFSDNTHRDIILNAQGIRNIYVGEYEGVDGTVTKGTSLEDVIKEVNGDLASEMSALSKESIENVEGIEIPFDFALTQEVVGGNGPIMQSVLTLQDQGDKIAEIAAALGYTISVELPE